MSIQTQKSAEWRTKWIHTYAFLNLDGEKIKQLKNKFDNISSLLLLAVKKLFKSLFIRSIVKDICYVHIFA